MQDFLMLVWEKEEMKETGRKESETILFLHFVSLKLEFYSSETEADFKHF